jgi:hypothetical protein
MRLGFEILSNVQNVNSFDEPASYTLYLGNPDTLYFRLVNLDEVDTTTGKYLRWVPLVADSITVQFKSIDSNKNLSKVATQPFQADDRSIWSVPILPSDAISAMGMTLTMISGGQTYTLLPVTQLVTDKTNDGRFYC